MTLYSFLRYISHRWNAKGRHGTHSPLVYAFVEDCIEKNKDEPLESRIDQYFKDWQIVRLNGAPVNWRDEIESSLPPVDVRQLFIVPDIHHTKSNTGAWSVVCRLPAVDYSIDLFDFGLLLIDGGLKEKQHFVLKK